MSRNSYLNYLGLFIQKELSLNNIWINFRGFFRQSYELVCTITVPYVLEIDDKTIRMAGQIRFCKLKNYLS
jgi:hypothetical protein